MLKEVCSALKKGAAQNMGLFDKLFGKDNRNSHHPKEPSQVEARNLFNWFNSEAFYSHQKYLNGTLAGLPVCEAPKGWHKKFSAAVGGLEYIGFSQSSDSLLTISSSGSGLWDLPTGEKSARVFEKDSIGLDEKTLICRGIGMAADEYIHIAGIGGGGLRTISGKGERLVIVSPEYPCHDVVFEANNQSCFAPGENHDCIIVYRGFVKPNMCGFSYSGDYFIVTDEDIHVWGRST